jgi:uncharacterized protein (DUF1015 family)
MALVRPFRGIRYNPEKVEVPAAVTPPYDVISEQDQERYYSQSEYSFVRLILGKKHDSDGPLNNRYTRARDYLRDWLAQGVLARERKEAIYVYEQKFNGKTRRGFIARMEIEDFSQGTVIPHERTLSGPKADRLELMKTTEANFGLIFLLYSDPEGRIDSLLEKQVAVQPVTDFVFENGVANRIWVMDDPEVTKKIEREMEDKVVYIADGHHRYETRLAYRDGAGSGNEAARYGLMAFFNMDNPGLEIYPTHRLIYGLEGVDPLDLVKRLEDFFFVQQVEEAEIFSLLKSKGKHSFGLCVPKSCLLLTLKSEELAVTHGDSSRSADWNLLDVSILHSLIIEKLLGVERLEEHVRYTRNDDEAIQKVNSGEYQLALLLNATTIEEFKAIASNRERMPQKSTYFYPKLLSGLVIYKFE